MENYVKYTEGKNKGLVKSCAYPKKLIMPPNPPKTSVDLTFKPIPLALAGKKSMDCPMMGDGSCTEGRKMADRSEKPDGGYGWFDNRLKALEKAINNKKWGNVKKNVKRLNKFIQAFKKYNEQEKKKDPTDISRRVYGLKWYSHAIHDKLLEINNNAYLKKNNIILQLNDIIYCANDTVAGCNNGTWERDWAASNPNCMKKQPTSAFGSTVKSKAKPLIKPSMTKKETTTKYACASRLSKVQNKETGQFDMEAAAKEKCSDREIVVPVPAWVVGGRKSRRRRRRRSRKKGRKSRKSRRRNKRKSRKKRSRRKSRKRRRR